MKIIINIFIVLVLLSTSIYASNPWDNGDLIVGQDKRTLVHKNNKEGFYWMGDTAWDLAYRLKDSEIKTYLQNRKDKGFTVIQMRAVWKPDLRMLGKYKPFKTTYYSNKINETYWKHIDFVINEAAKRGLYIALLPTWMNELKDNQVDSYARFIVNRYKNKHNIIWVLGGDTDFNPKNRNKWRKFANIIHTYDKKHLVTFHPKRNLDKEQNYSTNSKALHKEKWLDFVMLQTGHKYRSLSSASKKLKTAYYTKPTKPILDGEPRYEDIGESCNYGYVYKDYHARSIAYLDLFSGAFGHTYGHNAIWMMSTTKGCKFWYNDSGDHGGCLKDYKWYTAINSAGAKQISYLNKLMHNKVKRVHDQSIIKNGKGLALRGSDFVYVYLPYNGSNTITLNMGKISGDTLRYRWFRPSSGKYNTSDTDIIANSGTHTFTRPSKYSWVLVLDKDTTPIPTKSTAYMVSPKNGSKVATTQKFAWNKKSYVKTVHLYIWDDTTHKSVYSSGKTTAWNKIVKLPAGHKLIVILTSYDSNGNKIGGSRHYTYTVKAAPKPAAVNYNVAYIVSPGTSGYVSTYQKFKWNKKSSIKTVEFYIWDDTAHKKVYSKGRTTAWNATVHLPKGHRIKVILTSYDSHGRKVGGSNKYVYTVR